MCIRDSRYCYCYWCVVLTGVYILLWAPLDRLTENKYCYRYWCVVLTGVCILLWAPLGRLTANLLLLLLVCCAYERVNITVGTFR